MSYSTGLWYCLHWLFKYRRLELSNCTLDMSKQCQRRRPRGTPIGSTSKQVKKRLVPRTSGVTERVKGMKKQSFLDSSNKERFVLADGAVAQMVSLTVASLFSTQALQSTWIADKERDLVGFIMMTTRGDSWPRTINKKFWEAAAMFVSHRCYIRGRTCKTS